MKIDEKTYKAMPPHLQTMFLRLPNPGSEEVVRLFPDTTSGGREGGEVYKLGRFQGMTGARGLHVGTACQGSSGSAARFFYCAKASREDREWALEGMEEREAQSTRWSGDGMPRRQDGTERKMPKARNHHPTVKPLDLMRYLCRLVTPPGGIVLDPFAGSGSTLRGAFLEGFKPIGIELDAEYCRIARGRMNLLTPAMAGLMG